STYSYNEQNRLVYINKDGVEFTNYRYDNNSNMLGFNKEKIEHICRIIPVPTIKIFELGKTSEQENYYIY
ncbi:MAG: hypothetical protein MJA31_20835, partial [Clostridia bacterium]|nr:hypothetical protein [Clostridia bacterium]